MPDILPYKEYSMLAAFSFLSGLVFSMTGVLYAMVGEVTRYSNPQVILISCFLVGLGLVMTLVGVNFGGMRRTLSRNRSFLAGVLLSLAGLLIFFVSYPESWFYPMVAYSLISYSLGILLLLINIFVNYYAGIFALSDYHYTGISENEANHHEFKEHIHREDSFMANKNSSVSLTFAGILLANLLPGHPDRFSHGRVEKSDEVFINEGHGLNEIAQTENDALAPAAMPEGATGVSDNMIIEEDTVQNDLSGEETKQTEAQDETGDVGIISVEDKNLHNIPFSEFVSMKKTNINADDTMREAARKLLMFHFGEMVKNERGTKVGKDIEDLHDMRVAAMRMRSGVEVLEDYLNMEEMSSHYKNIKSTRKVLGTVRDLDVFLEKIDHYLEGQPPERRLEMDPLEDSILIERAKNRGNMLVYLDDARYNKFKKNFADYLSQKKSWKMKSLKNGEPVPRKVKDVLPVLLYEQFAIVRAYDEHVSGEAVVDPSLDQYHKLRIDVKILRYTLEFFKEVLGSESKDLIKDLKALQDNLGDMHDTVVALELLENFEKYGRWGETDKKNPSGYNNGLQDYPGVDAYLEYRRQELQDLLEAFPAVWAKVMEPDFSVRFSQAISGIYMS